MTRWLPLPHSGPILISSALAIIALAVGSPGFDHAQAQTTIDQISIDMSPDDVHPRVTPFVNGDDAVGDRDANGQPDAEGAADQINGIVGTCGNGIDDDQGDWDGSGTVGDAFGEIDGVADDGCVKTLGPWDACIEIWGDDILTAREDTG